MQRVLKFWVTILFGQGEPETNDYWATCANNFGYNFNSTRSLNEISTDLEGFVDSLDYEGNRLGLSGYVKNHNNYNYLYKYLQVQWINKIE